MAMIIICTDFGTITETIVSFTTPRYYEVAGYGNTLQAEEVGYLPESKADRGSRLTREAIVAARARGHGVAPGPDRKPQRFKSNARVCSGSQRYRVML